MSAAPAPNPRPGPPGRRSPTIVDALRQGLVDPELAALLWVLLEGGVPCVVVGPGADPADRARRDDAVGALLDLLPTSRTRWALTGGSEEFTWLPDAESLGWRRGRPVDPTLPAAEATTLLAGELGGSAPTDPTGERSRLLVRALGRGYGLVATARAAGLEELLETLRARPIRLTDDELTRLGIVLVLGRGPDAPMEAAHYLRPLALDAHGHTQRLPPAVLATWDPRTGRFEHFAWGVATELARRVGRRTRDFELEVERRAAALAALAGPVPPSASPTPVDSHREVEAAIKRLRLGEAAPGTVHRH